MNTLRITQTAATIATLMGFSMAEGADIPNEIVLDAAAKYFAAESPDQLFAAGESDKCKVERALLYNPDAIALWLYQKYTTLFTPVIRSSSMALPVYSVMPSVTPVCFASMYTGLMPEKHGIQSYTKPVLQVPTLFDAAIAAGKKPIIISTKRDSISEIFKERRMDYIFCDSADECNERALEVIAADQHDLITIYNGNYDSTMHKEGPEAELSLAALTHNANAYERLTEAAQKAWAGKKYLAAFLPDHGCHEIDGNCGSHGLDMPEDMDIIHFYAFG